MLWFPMAGESTNCSLSVFWSFHAVVHDHRLSTDRRRATVVL